MVNLATGSHSYLAGKFLFIVLIMSSACSFKQQPQNVSKAEHTITPKEISIISAENNDNPLVLQGSDAQSLLIAPQTDRNASSKVTALPNLPNLEIIESVNDN